MSVIYSNPGIYSWYPSKGSRYWNGSFEGCGPKYVWCCELGYPNVDVKEWEDGEQAIIEFYNSPVIPSLTRWNFILSGIKNVEISRGFLTKYINQLNLQKKQVWDDAEAKTKKIEEEKARLDQHAQDTAEKAKDAIIRNPDLVQRIAKKGLGEINLDKIYGNIPRHQKIGL